MLLDDKARDYHIVHSIDFTQNGVMTHPDLTVHYDFDIISELGGGRHWVVEHTPTSAVFSIQYFTDENIENSVTFLTTQCPIVEEDFNLLKLAITNEEWK